MNPPCDPKTLIASLATGASCHITMIDSYHLQRSSRCCAKMRYRDKDYLRTPDNMLFNVTGYEHPSEAVYASLKYVSGEKWRKGYAEARRFLQAHAPRFVADYIQVPHDAIAESYCPRRRWQMLAARPQRGLLDKAYRLGLCVAQQLKIPLNQLGVTDSLLWGSGHDASDIDLVVFGTRHVSRLLGNAARLFQQVECSRPLPERVTAPYGYHVPCWPSLLDRKQHMGMFCGTPFSLRGVREWSEVQPCRISGTARRMEIDFQVADASESLFFPAIYYDVDRRCLIDYTVVYEGVLRMGDVFQGVCEVTKRTSGQTAFVVLPDQIANYAIHSYRS